MVVVVVVTTITLSVYLCGSFYRPHLDTSAELRYSVGSLVDSQSDYRSTKVIRRPRRGRMGVRRDEPKVNPQFLLIYSLIRECISGC